MKKIKVKAIFGAWQGYQEIANHPPEGVEYVGIGKSTKKGQYYKSKKIREKAGAFLQKLKVPRMIFVMPGDYDLIHSSRGIIPLNRKSWVIDMEHVHSFFGLNPNLIKNEFWKRFIEKKLASDKCKAILCHCEATRQAFFYYLDCSKFKDKIKVLYPASHMIPLKKIRHDKIRILAVISLFYHKGGPQILEAFSKLEKKYKNIELWIKADPPEEFKKKYISKNIHWFPYFGQILPREKLLQKFHAQCDIFVYPSFCDSFGYGLVDAMIAGLPIITTNLFAFPEIVKDKVNGFVIKIPRYDLKKGFVQVHRYQTITNSENKKIVEELVKNMEKLIKSKKLRERIGKENILLAKTGKFSTKGRNKELIEVYKEALK
ncbi:MAG: glycosyltransferase family 4 protein [Candidatus Pacearchaeota archaeon]|nr:glycosyltransferase family 4 protein [Candidatus Pacearchaeota archaeon]